jgi:hypothetical protein
VCGSASVQEVAHALRLDHSAASRRCRTAQGRGYIHNEETSRGRPARYVLSTPLPAEQPVLPEPHVLATALGGDERQGSVCTSEVRTEGDNPPPPPHSPEQPRAQVRRRIVL